MSAAAIGALSAAGVLMLAVFGAVWRLGTKMGQMTQELHDHNGRLERVENHQDAHDECHLDRGDR
jgi:hypothetical protein